LLLSLGTLFSRLVQAVYGSAAPEQDFQNTNTRFSISTFRQMEASPGGVQSASLACIHAPCRDRTRSPALV
jgi:hypothetical protein